MKKYYRKEIILVTLLVIVNVIFASFCYFASLMSVHQTTEKTVSGLFFDNAKDSPKSVLHNKPSFYHSFTLTFDADFSPKDDNYPNLFQAGKDPKTLRLELIHPTIMQAIIGYEGEPFQQIYLISNKVKMNKWNHVSLDYDSNKRLTVKLNNEPALTVKDARFDPQLKDFALGTGFDRQRNFLGQIKNAKFTVVFNETNLPLYFLKVIWNDYLIIILLQLLFLFRKPLKKNLLQIKGKEYQRIFTQFLLTFSTIAGVIIISGIFAFPLSGNRKWIPYLLTLLPSTVFALNFIKKEWFVKEKYIQLIGGIFLFAIPLIGAFRHGITAWSGTSGILLLFLCLFVIPLFKRYSLIFVGTLIFLFGINSIDFLIHYGIFGLLWTVPILFAIIIVFHLSLSDLDRSSRWLMINKIGFVISVLVSLFLSFRTDALFLGTSLMHWGYFTGVIQTIRSGGELLWSAPSQYGFLNILFPSLLPYTSRTSLFIFQAILLFICAILILRTIYLSFNRSTIFIVIAFTGLSLFFFADPDLIGPTLYPSSSVVRFFCVYLLLFVILTTHYKKDALTGGIKWLVTGAYFLGALWSAESMLYCTAIYGIYLSSSAIGMLHLKEKKKEIITFLSKNIFVILVGFILVNIIYIVITHHFPDWSMFVMYAFSYAGGFGEISIDHWGILWAVVLGLSSIVLILWQLYKQKKYNEWVIISSCFIALWAITSYYIGRAVVNNFTAILPLIFYIFIIISTVLIKIKAVAYRFFLNAVFVPWIVVGIAGGIGNPQLVETIPHFRIAENVDAKSFIPSIELATLLQKLDAAKGTRIVYYGDPFTNPVIQNSRGNYIDLTNGMPMPLTLLETPITDQERKNIIGRFMLYNNAPVYFIHKKNEPNTRFSDWYSFFVTNYSIKKIRTTSTYEIFVIKKR